jgi:hypothetical protein
LTAALALALALTLTLALALTFAPLTATGSAAKHTLRPALTLALTLALGAARLPAATAAAQPLHFADGVVDRLDVRRVPGYRLGLLRRFLLGTQELLQARQGVIARRIET